MKAHVAAIAGHELAGTVRELAAHATRWGLAESPEDADLVLLCGSFTRDFRALTGHSLYRRYTRKCAVYSGDDAYCPLAPGVYTSARKGPSTRLGRVRSHAYASSFGLHGNRAVAEAGRWESTPRGQREECQLLFSFEGAPTSRVRRRLFAQSFPAAAVLVRDTSHFYSHFDHAAPGREQGQLRYVETMRRSRFALCPRGEGSGTLRLFEAMSLGVAPVLLSDDYVLPRGPRWEDFLVRVPERRLGSLVAVLGRLEDSSAQRGRLAREAWLEWFAPEVLFDRLLDAAWECLGAARLLEGGYRRSSALLAGGFELRRGLRRAGVQLARRSRLLGP